MDSRPVLAIALVIAASGCIDNGAGPDIGGTDKGSLQIVEFDISDPHMTTNQQARIDLMLENHNTGDVEINEISIYNTAFLEVGDKSCTPETIESADEDFTPRMECSWIVTAPPDLSGFSSRPLTFQLNLDYDSELSNKDSPVPIEFRPAQDIDERTERVEEYSNGEVEVTVSYREPMPADRGFVDFRITPEGPGNIVSNYSMEYQPSEIFEDCDTEIEPVVAEGIAEFTCEVSSEEEPRVTRSLIFSTSYKYVKSPSLDIEVAKP